MAETIIRVNNITAKYDEKTVLENVSLNIEENDYLGIIGPNGGGKTTLIRIILGMKEAADGSVEYFSNGKPVDNITMGYLPQYSNIDKKFPISVYDVVLSGLDRKKGIFHKYTKEQHTQVEKTLADMEILDLKDTFIGALSGGQLQRVLLARAMVSNPKVLILDEPNTYVDKKFQRQMYAMLNNLNNRCAIIMVSHDIAEIVHQVKHIACVNHHIHYHATADMPQEEIEEHFLNI